MYNVIQLKYIFYIILQRTGIESRTMVGTAPNIVFVRLVHRDLHRHELHRSPTEINNPDDPRPSDRGEPSSDDGSDGRRAGTVQPHLSRRFWPNEH